jgi:zinc protease
MNDETADYAALTVANRVLGGSTESRLFARIRVRDGLSYNVGTALDPAVIDENSQFYVFAIFAPQNLSKVRTGIRDVLARALDQGLDDAEIAAARSAILQERAIARSQDGTLAGSLVLQSYLSRTWVFSAKLDAALGAVTAAQASAALRKYVKPEAIAYVAAGDFK